MTPRLVPRKQALGRCLVVRCHLSLLHRKQNSGGPFTDLSGTVQPSGIQMYAYRTTVLIHTARFKQRLQAPKLTLEHLADSPRPTRHSVHASPVIPAKPVPEEAGIHRGWEGAAFGYLPTAHTPLVIPAKPVPEEAGSGNPEGSGRGRSHSSPLTSRRGVPARNPRRGSSRTAPKCRSYPSNSRRLPHPFSCPNPTLRNKMRSRATGYSPEYQAPAYGHLKCGNYGLPRGPIHQWRLKWTRNETFTCSCSGG